MVNNPASLYTQGGNIVSLDGVAIVHKAQEINTTEKKQSLISELSTEQKNNLAQALNDIDKNVKGVLPDEIRNVSRVSDRVATAIGLNPENLSPEDTKRVDGIIKELKGANDKDLFKPVPQNINPDPGIYVSSRDLAGIDFEWANNSGDSQVFAFNSEIAENRDEILAGLDTKHFEDNTINDPKEVKADLGKVYDEDSWITKINIAMNGKDANEASETMINKRLIENYTNLVHPDRSGEMKISEELNIKNLNESSQLLVNSLADEENKEAVDLAINEVEEDWGRDGGINGFDVTFLINPETGEIAKNEDGKAIFYSGLSNEAKTKKEEMEKFIAANPEYQAIDIQRTGSKRRLPYQGRSEFLSFEKERYAFSNSKNAEEMGIGNILQGKEKLTLTVENHDAKFVDSPEGIQNSYSEITKLSYRD
ncbi:MAG: hypothetical protein HRT47_03575 [Candidatus Caenarcaniphilales bacterium]|nr:hypothetical protein [Candidatus Caenarcaniphilales bacterium]